jgi:hypothetical protein
MNVSGADADITVAYAHASLSAGTEDYSQTQLAVPDGASVTFYMNGILEAVPGGATSEAGTQLPPGSLAAATVTATGNVVAIVNESNDDTGRKLQTTYSAIPTSEGGSKVGIPLAKEEFWGKTSGIQIQNAGSGAVTVQVTYNFNAGPAACLDGFVLENISIDEGSSVTLYRLSAPGASLPGGGNWVDGSGIVEGCLGGATIDVIGSGSVVAVVQEAQPGETPDARQDNKNYEGFKIE